MSDKVYPHRLTESAPSWLSRLRQILSGLKAVSLFILIVVVILPVWAILSFIEVFYMRLRGYRFNDGWGYYEKIDTLRIIAEARARARSESNDSR